MRRVVTFAKAQVHVGRMANSKILLIARRWMQRAMTEVVLASTKMQPLVRHRRAGRQRTNAGGHWRPTIAWRRVWRLATSTGHLTALALKTPHTSFAGRWMETAIANGAIARLRTTVAKILIQHASMMKQVAQHLRGADPLLVPRQKMWLAN